MVAEVGSNLPVHETHKDNGGNGQACHGDGGCWGMRSLNMWSITCCERSHQISLSEMHPMTMKPASPNLNTTRWKRWKQRDRWMTNVQRRTMMHTVCAYYLLTPKICVPSTVNHGFLCGWYLPGSSQLLLLLLPLFLTCNRHGGRNWSTISFHLLNALPVAQVVCWSDRKEKIKQTGNGKTKMVRNEDLNF